VVQTGLPVAVGGIEDVQILTSGQKTETISVIACNNAEVSFLSLFQRCE
jgi:hypothetical protein